MTVMDDMTVPLPTMGQRLERCESHEGRTMNRGSVRMRQSYVWQLRPETTTNRRGKRVVAGEHTPDEHYRNRGTNWPTGSEGFRHGSDDSDKVSGG